MTDTNFRTAFVEELTRIAPDIEAEAVGDDDHLQDDLDLDSMDVLNLVAALHERFGVNIPEADYEKISTVRRAAAYLASSV